MDKKEFIKIWVHDLEMYKNELGNERLYKEWLFMVTEYYQGNILQSANKRVQSFFNIYKKQMDFILEAKHHGKNGFAVKSEKQQVTGNTLEGYYKGDLKEPLKQKIKEKEKEKDKRKPVQADEPLAGEHKKIIDCYIAFIENRTGAKPKITAADGSAIKNLIIPAFKDSKTTPSMAMEWIFNNWDAKINDSFLKKQVKLTQIASNIVNIQNDIKNGKAQGGRAKQEKSHLEILQEQYFGSPMEATPETQDTEFETLN